MQQSQDVHYITLDTPPGSPTTRIQYSDDEDNLPSAGSSLPPKIITPLRKRRQEKGTRQPPSKKRALANGPAVTAPDEDVFGSDLADNVTTQEDFSMDEGHLRGNLDPVGYEEYVDTVIQEGGAFYQIGQDLFIANGWDPRTKTCKLSWYHLQRSLVGDSTVIVCRCPLAKPDSPCVHERFLVEYGREMFDEDFGRSDASVVLFSRQETSPDCYLNYFSSPSPNSRALNGWTVVTYEGTDLGDGIWSCAKDSNALTCTHINKSKDMLQKLVRIDPSARDQGVAHGSGIDYAVPSSRRSAKDTKSVSHLPVSPPVWASLPTDILHYAPVKPIQEPPGIISLMATSSCCCSHPRQLYDPELPTKHQKCTVYGLYRSWEAETEVQACPNCSHRLVGPDCRELGFFNYNNRKLFTHDLLDEYTSAYTSSETPFSAWVSVVARRYEIHGDGQKFISHDMFRAVWFSYVELQDLEGDTTCPRCGPAPENTIWDGVTLAFNRKHLLPTLEPPTVSQTTSAVRDRTRYIAAQQLIPDARVRKLVRKVITGPQVFLGAGIAASVIHIVDENDGEGDDEDDEDDENTEDGGRGTSKERAAKRGRAEILERLEAIPLALQGLQRLDDATRNLFDLHFGEGSVVHSQAAPEVYRRLFHQISAQESVLQMANSVALDCLEAFVLSPTAKNATALVDIPVIREVLLHELPDIPPEIVSVCRWILNRGRLVLNELIKYDGPPKIPAGTPEKAWKVTGCFYGLPKIRERPIYPKLKHDVRNDVGGKRGAKCSKFYSQYGERRLTGGIMVVWCTHSISYGFHCIPRGEGRNDVFSALITRWETPPKRVIYDFACALGPYCMTREPEFFSGTQFLIDDFHAMGHTKCSPAAFLKTYCNADPRLSHINSSAGECGNSGISRIRKSVSYMSQSRAIVYTKVFLSVWNRLRIRNLA